MNLALRIGIAALLVCALILGALTVLESRGVFLAGPCANPITLTVLLLMMGSMLVGVVGTGVGALLWTTRKLRQLRQA